MLILISPAKTLDESPLQHPHRCTQPALLEHAQVLIEQLKQLNPDAVGQLMKISPKLALLNQQRFSIWQQPFNAANAKAALYMFKGDVYQGLDAPSLSPEDMAFSQDHLRILSGLYGVLRPLDLMQAYRLEMGTRLKNERGNNLYAFWGGLIAEQLQSHQHIINLASNEYYKAVKGQLSNVITPVFKDEKNGKLKVIGIHAKKARGLMTRFIIQQRLSEPSAMTAFTGMNYEYADALSSANEWVFIR
ncbi:MAG: peroxide stress protein YaaA [Mariprofundaceae bacterium]|nr:peroxide stress protein YaaA [Mariprofundaceae bacterium]